MSTDELLAAIPSMLYAPILALGSAPASRRILITSGWLFETA